MRFIAFDFSGPGQTYSEYPNQLLGQVSLLADQASSTTFSMPRTPLLGRLGRDIHVICCSFSALGLESSKWTEKKLKKLAERGTDSDKERESKMG
jgi:hypothetical protein